MANFKNTSYNRNVQQGALSDIKRLLTCRDTVAQNKACGYLTQVINRHENNTNERKDILNYLLDNDITIFLCEATSNMDYTLLRSILECFRLLWCNPRYFTEQHAAHSVAAVVRVFAYYADEGSHVPLRECLHFLGDLFHGISANGASSPLSFQSVYSVDQLLACLLNLAPTLNSEPKNFLSSAYVLFQLISYQPTDLSMKGATANALAVVLDEWLLLLTGALNHSTLMGKNQGMFYVIQCNLGIKILKLSKLLQNRKKKSDFVQKILIESEELNALKESALQMIKIVNRILNELVIYTEENEKQLSSGEYRAYLKFMLCFFKEINDPNVSGEFCDTLYTKGYLRMLPKVSVERNELEIRKISTLILGEMLIRLAEKYLCTEDIVCDEMSSSMRDSIHTGLFELQYGIENTENVGARLQKDKPYCLIIYIYFYCQSTENPEEATSPLLPYLVDNLLAAPRFRKPPPYIIKALWLIFAMSSISNESLKSLEERVNLEKATDHLLDMLNPKPCIFYTHSPAILLWTFTSHGIPKFIRMKVLSQWLTLENSLPKDIMKALDLWELLLNVLVETTDEEIKLNCDKALYECLEETSEEDREDFSCHVWSMLPEVISKHLISRELENNSNICNILNLARSFVPAELESETCFKTAVLLTALFSKSFSECGSDSVESRYQYEHVCLALALNLLKISIQRNDTRVILTYTNHTGFLASVLSVTNSLDDNVACAALELLTYVVNYFAVKKYQAKTHLEIQTHLIIKSLKADSLSERGVSLLNLVSMIINHGSGLPLVLSKQVQVKPSMDAQCCALRALMFRTQMICCQESQESCAAGLKALAAIFKHAVIHKDDSNLVSTLTLQPYTYTLIHFQITQPATQAFLTFAQYWLSLLKITLRMKQPSRRYSKHSLITKTMVLIQRYIIIEDDQLRESKEMVLKIANEIADEYCTLHFFSF